VLTWSPLGDVKLAGATQVSLWFVNRSTCARENAGKLKHASNEECACMQGSCDDAAGSQRPEADAEKITTPVIYKVGHRSMLEN
jgi:hypothetical protein